MERSKKCRLIFMILTGSKNLAEELRELRYRNLRNIPSFRFWEDSDRESRVCARRWDRVSFRGWDKYYWLTAEAEIPEAFCGEEVLGLFDFGAPSGTGNNGNFESLLYINDVPYQAVDGNHREVFFGPGVCGKKLQLKFRLWTGLSGGGPQRQCDGDMQGADRCAGPECG